MSRLSGFPWLRIVVWALVLGVIFSVWADWGRWDRFALNTLERIGIVLIGGLAGWVLNLFAGMYVGMGTNVIESTGMFRFSSDTPRKIENGFIFICALVGAIIAAATIR